MFLRSCRQCLDADRSALTYDKHGQTCLPPYGMLSDARKRLYRVRQTTLPIAVLGKMLVA